MEVTSNVAPGIDTLFDGQDGCSNGFKYLEVDSVCRVFFMFVGIRLYGARTGLPDTDKRCISPCKARSAHFPNLINDLPEGGKALLWRQSVPDLDWNPRDLLAEALPNQGSLGPTTRSCAQRRLGLRHHYDRADKYLLTAFAIA